MAVAACAEGGSNGSAPIQPSTTTVTATRPMAVSVPPAPAQTGAGKPVRFDPCVELSDELVVKAGFDPASRERDAGELVTDSLTVIGCSFSRISIEDGNITGFAAVTSRNLQLAQIRTSQSITILNADPINARPALLYTERELPGSCRAAIESTDGTFDVTLTAVPGPVPVPAPCDEIREVATTFAAALGDK
jgi:hypothetical protein